MPSRAILGNLLNSAKHVFQRIVNNTQTKAVRQVVVYQPQVTNSKFRKVCQNIIPKYYFNSIANQFGRRAAWRHGRIVPLYSFVGLVMAQHAEKEEEDILRKVQSFADITDAVISPLLHSLGKVSLEQFEIGQFIGQGSNEAVYEAHLITEHNNNIEAVDTELSKSHNISHAIEKELPIVADDMNDGIPEGGVERYNSLDSSIASDISGKFNLAVKIISDYGAVSNADAMLRKLRREAVPERLDHVLMETRQNWNKVKRRKLPPHPNVVCMYGLLVDWSCNNTQGIMGNLKPYIVMKKYQYTLGEFLNAFDPIVNERLVLFAQLLEAVSHMRNHDIAHRNLKLENIFIDSTTVGIPHLVVGDFGSCLADGPGGLQIPYHIGHMDRGDNNALMAPEISTAEPGMYLDYRKSDIWATGALAYEILGADNPFYADVNKGGLDSRTYTEEELPPLPADVPNVVKQLVSKMLTREPRERPTARFAANVMNSFLWMPSDWLSPGKILTWAEVQLWCITMEIEVYSHVARSAERDLKSGFVGNLDIRSLNGVFNFLGVKIE